MTDECISPLRRRMIEDMTVRNFVPKTQSEYIRRVKNFAVFLGRTPDRASREDVRGYLLHLASSGVGAGTVNGTGSALRFFFDVTLDRADIVRHLPIAREPRKAPISSNQRNQDRYFMSQPKPQARKCAHLLRWLSAGRGSTRSNSQPSTQIAQKSSASDAGSRLLVSRILVGQPPASLRLPSGASAAAFKFP